MATEGQIRHPLFVHDPAHRKLIALTIIFCILAEGSPVRAVAPGTTPHAPAAMAAMFTTEALEPFAAWFTRPSFYRRIISAVQGWANRQDSEGRPSFRAPAPPAFRDIRLDPRRPRLTVEPVHLAAYRALIETQPPSSQASRADALRKALSLLEDVPSHRWVAEMLASLWLIASRDLQARQTLQSSVCDNPANRGGLDIAFSQPGALREVPSVWYPPQGPAGRPMVVLDGAFLEALERSEALWRTSLAADLESGVAPAGVSDAGDLARTLVGLRAAERAFVHEAAHVSMGASLEAQQREEQRVMQVEHIVHAASLRWIGQDRLDALSDALKQQDPQTHRRISAPKRYRLFQALLQTEKTGDEAFQGLAQRLYPQPQAHALSMAAEPEGDGEEEEFQDQELAGEAAVTDARPADEVQARRALEQMQVMLSDTNVYVKLWPFMSDVPVLRQLRRRQEGGRPLSASEVDVVDTIFRRYTFPMNKSESKHFKNVMTHLKSFGSQELRFWAFHGEQRRLKEILSVAQQRNVVMPRDVEWLADFAIRVEARRQFSRRLNLIQALEHDAEGEWLRVWTGLAIEMGETENHALYRHRKRFTRGIYELTPTEAVRLGEGLIDQLRTDSILSQKRSIQGLSQYESFFVGTLQAAFRDDPDRLVQVFGDLLLYRNGLRLSKMTAVIRAIEVLFSLEGNAAALEVLTRLRNGENRAAYQSWWKSKGFSTRMEEMLLAAAPARTAEERRQRAQRAQADRWAIVQQIRSDWNEGYFPYGKWYEQNRKYLIKRAESVFRSRRIAIVSAKLPISFGFSAEAPIHMSKEEVDSYVRTNAGGSFDWVVKPIEGVLRKEEVDNNVRVSTARRFDWVLKHIEAILYHYDRVSDAFNVHGKSFVFPELQPITASEVEERARKEISALLGATAAKRFDPGLAAAEEFVKRGQFETAVAEVRNAVGALDQAQDEFDGFFPENEEIPALGDLRKKASAFEQDVERIKELKAKLSGEHKRLEALGIKAALVKNDEVLFQRARRINALAEQVAPAVRSKQRAKIGNKSPADQVLRDFPLVDRFHLFTWWPTEPRGEFPAITMYFTREDAKRNHAPGARIVELEVPLGSVLAINREGSKAGDARQSTLIATVSNEAYTHAKTTRKRSGGTMGWLREALERALNRPITASDYRRVIAVPAELLVSLAAGVPLGLLVAQVAARGEPGTAAMLGVLAVFWLGHAFDLVRNATTPAARRESWGLLLKNLGWSSSLVAPSAISLFLFTPQVAAPVIGGLLTLGHLAINHRDRLGLTVHRFSAAA